MWSGWTSTITTKSWQLFHFKYFECQLVFIICKKNVFACKFLKGLSFSFMILCLLLSQQLLFTMSDFMILVSLKNVKKYSHVVARLPQTVHLSSKNETKILKVTHSAPLSVIFFSIWTQNLLEQPWEYLMSLGLVLYTYLIIKLI